MCSLRTLRDPAAIKARLRTRSFADMEALARRALACKNAAEVRAL